MNEEKIPVQVYIRNNETGETRIYTDVHWTQKDFDEGYFQFQYGENNYACDCNRALFFARSNGEEDPETRDCTVEKFTITQCLTPDGTDIYHDEDDAAAGVHPAAS